MKKYNRLIMLTLAFSIAFGETKPTAVMINGVPATVIASSELTSKTPGAYSVKNLFDHDEKTAWVEGVKGKGTGEYFEIEFTNATKVLAISISPGYLKNEKSFMENTVPSIINIKTEKEDIGSFEINYETEYNATQSTFGSKYCTQTNSPLNWKAERIFFFNSPKICKRLEVTIVNVLDGDTRFSDMCISEFKPIFSFADEKKQTGDSTYFLIYNLINKNSIDKLTKSADIAKLDTISLSEDFYTPTYRPKITYAEIIQKKINDGNKISYDTVTIKNPERIPRLLDPKCGDKSCFVNVLLSSFTNSFLTICDINGNTLVIGDWNIQYRAESDEGISMARYPVLLIRENKIRRIFEVPVTLDEGECSFLPELKLLNN